MMIRDSQVCWNDGPRRELRQVTRFGTIDKGNGLGG